MKIYYPTSMFNTKKIATTTCFAVESKFIALFQFKGLDIKRLVMFLMTVFLKILIIIFYNNVHNKTLRHEQCNRWMIIKGNRNWKRKEKKRGEESSNSSEVSTRIKEEI